MKDENQIAPEIQALLDESARTMALFTNDYKPLNMYAIFRKDLEMTMGKLGAQAGHAFEMSYEVAKKIRPEITAQYKGSGNGTKICMYAKNFGQLQRAYLECRELGLPCWLVIDRNHIHLPHFTGVPIVTALGIGPVYREEVAHITKRYTMIK